MRRFTESTSPVFLQSILAGVDRVKHRSIAQTIIVALLVCFAATASAAPYVKPAVPDFFQHQNIDTDATWQPGVGWCYDVATADALYSLNLRANYRGLYDVGANPPYAISDKINAETDWFAASTSAIKDLAASPNIPAYLKARNHGEDAGLFKGLIYSQFVVDNPTDKQVTDVLPADGGYKGIDGFAGDNKVKYFLPTKPGDPKKVAPVGASVEKAFAFYNQQLTAGDGAKGVMLQVGKGTNTEVKPVIWWGNFHEVGGVGVDVAASNIYFADPDSNKGSKKADAGWDFKDNYAPAIARKYKLPDDKAVPIASVLNPANADFGKYYGTWHVAADGISIDGGVEDPDRYKGTQIRKIETISPSLAVLIGQPILQGANRWLTNIKLSSLPGELIDKLIIAPASNVDPTQFLPGSTPTDYAKGLGPQGSWTNGAYSPLDPWNNPLQYGAAQYDFVTGSGVPLDEFGVLSLSLITQNLSPSDIGFTAFNVYSHYVGDPSTDWDVQAFGAGSLPFDHFQVPEPGTLALLGLGLAVLAARRRRNA